MKKDELIKLTYETYKQEAKECGMSDKDILTFEEFVNEIKNIKTLSL